jgi:hypothetical protein
MQSIDIEPLPPTGDRRDFLVTVLDDFGHEGTFVVEITNDLPTGGWLQGQELAGAARALADELGASVMRSEELAGRRFRFSTYTAGATLDAAIMLVRSNGPGGFDAPEQ